MDVPNKTIAATLKPFQWLLCLIQASRMRSTYDSMAAPSKQQVIKKGDSSQVYLILVQRCGLEAISQWVAVRACQWSHSAVCVCNSDQRQTSMSQVSPILA